MMANSKAWANQVPEGFAKVLTDRKTDKILGVHIVSAIAEESIAEAALAMTKGATGKKLGKMSHTHPTMAEALKEASLAAFDRSIHLRHRDDKEGKKADK